MLFSKSPEYNPNYCARLARVESTEPIRGADRIQACIVRCERYVCGKELRVGDPVIVFHIGTELTSEFLRLANLWSEPSKNSDPSARPGLFKTNGKIKSIKIRGIQSPGLVLPLSSLIDQTIYKVNQSEIENLIEQQNAGFDIFNDILCCKRAQTAQEEIEAPVRHKIKRTKKENPGAPQIRPGFFSFHYDTQMLADNMFRIEPKTILSISIKMHGTSVVLGRLPVARPLASTWIGRAFYRIFCGGKAYKTIPVCASRNRLRGLNEESIYNKALSVFSELMRPGEEWYCEIVGFDGQSPIQSGYDYGCEPGEFRIIPYRLVTHEYDVFGHLVKTEHTLSDVYSRTCLLKKKLESEGNTVAGSIEPVHIVYIGEAEEYYKKEEGMSMESWRQGLLEKLKDDKSFGMEELEPLCSNKVPREGIVIRTDGKNYSYGIPMAYKLKTAAFWRHEGL